MFALLFLSGTFLGHWGAGNLGVGMTDVDGTVYMAEGLLET